MHDSPTHDSPTQGSFKLDLGLVRQQQDHTFSRKWLMLSDKKDPSAGVKGYLKVSMICVL